MKNETKLLFDNYDINYDEWYEIYKENCLENEDKCYGRESEQFYNWVWEMVNIKWEDFNLNLKCDKNNNTECVVIGSLGLWWGRKDVQANFSTLSEAIDKCIGNSEYIIIYQNNGVIELKVIHHDGTNNFEIHKLNKKGINLMNKDLLYKEHYHKKFNIEF